MPGFGFAYSSLLILVTPPAALMYLVLFGYGPKGFEVRISEPPARGASQLQDCLLVSVNGTRNDAIEHEPEVRVNSTYVPWAYLRQGLEAGLKGRSVRAVFVEGDGRLEVGDIVRVIDMAHSVRPGVPLVLLTPTLKRTLSEACVGEERVP